ncbi:hypothetical protein ANN_27759 [Periplaneta americana]|uniref:Reverse transcriptase domain-containing protein n=1 Tax=Periplaneta americana TaxID=6978 RepID=A0ABQ8RV17_PERAM|nr:hypothetical protein ANN_27759 [Periplaneta americana]
MIRGSGDHNDSGKYKGIENAPLKMFTRIITNDITEIIEHLPDNQLGFRKGKSTLQAIEGLLKNVWDALEEKEEFGVIFIDFTKAFDFIYREIVKKKT